MINAAKEQFHAPGQPVFKSLWGERAVIVLTRYRGLLGSCSYTKHFTSNDILTLPIYPRRYMQLLSQPDKEGL